MKPRYVTPTLHLGTIPREDMTLATNAAHAVGIIEAGGVALVPDEATAIAVLCVLGVSEATAREKVGWARGKGADGADLFD